MMSKLPNLVMAGVPKAATTSVFAYLSAHPDVCPSSIKETQYFLPIRYGHDELDAIEALEKYFSSCGDVRYRMEATLGYLYGGQPLAARMKSILGDPKIIFMLRNPVERAMSFYRFEKGELRLDKKLTFDGYLEQCLAIPDSELELRKNNTYWAIGGGMYAHWMPDWYEVFEPQQIKVVFQENLTADPIAFLTDLCGWLGIDHVRFLSDLDLTRENKSTSYRNRTLQNAALRVNWGMESFWRSNPWLKKRLRSAYYAINGTPHVERMSDETRARLEEIYQPYNQSLAKLLAEKGVRNLPEWLAKELTPCVQS
jgi:hypothetical protein